MIPGSLISFFTPLSVLALSPSPGYAPHTGREISRSFSWEFRNQELSVQVSLNESACSYYESLPRYYGNYAWYTFDHPDYPVISEIAQGFASLGKQMELDDWGTLEMIIAWVQSLEYQREPSTKEYPKFPAETVRDGGGDCEDKSILLAGILRELNYDAVLLAPPGHMAVGLACNGCSGTRVMLDDDAYYYIETTSSGFQTGVMPQDFRNSSFRGVKLEIESAEEDLMRKQGDLYWYVLNQKVIVLPPQDE